MIIERFELWGKHPETSELECFGSTQHDQDQLNDTNGRIEVFNMMLNFAVGRWFSDGTPLDNPYYELASVYDGDKQKFIYQSENTDKVQR